MGVLCWSPASQVVYLQILRISLCSITLPCKKGGMHYAYFCVSSSTLAARVFILGILKNEDVFPRLAIFWGYIVNTSISILNRSHRIDATSYIQAMKFHTHPCHAAANAPGFALVATVSMMVLLTLVAIAMLSLSTIEQRSSGGGANEADRMARANARMALMIALGELQKAAGPDQRVTATAEYIGASEQHGLFYEWRHSGKHQGHPAVDGRKHWVGVWDTQQLQPGRPGQQTFLRWLVSGDQTSMLLAGTMPTAAPLCQ